MSREVGDPQTSGKSRGIEIVDSPAHNVRELLEMLLAFPRLPCHPTQKQPNKQQHPPLSKRHRPTLSRMRRFPSLRRQKSLIRGFLEEQWLKPRHPRRGGEGPRLRSLPSETRERYCPGVESVHPEAHPIQTAHWRGISHGLQCVQLKDAPCVCSEMDCLRPPRPRQSLALTPGPCSSSPVPAAIPAQIKALVGARGHLTLGQVGTLALSHPWTFIPYSFHPPTARARLLAAFLFALLRIRQSRRIASLSCLSSPPKQFASLLHR